MAQCYSQKTDISAVESHHASVRRHLVSRSTQTWQLDHASVSTEWILQNARAKLRTGGELKVPIPWAKHVRQDLCGINNATPLRQPALRKAENKLESTLYLWLLPLEQPLLLVFLPSFLRYLHKFGFLEDVKSQRCIGKRKKKKSKAGGTWRAFLKVHAGGLGRTRGLPEMKSLSEEYQRWKDVGDEKWNRIAVLGNSMTAVALKKKRDGNKPKPTAPALNFKLARRLHHRFAEERLCQSLRGVTSISAQADAIAKHCQDRQLGLVGAVHVAQVVTRRSALDRAQKRRQQQEKLQEYDDKIGQAQVSSLLEKLGLQTPELKFVAIPAGHMLRFQVQATAVPRAVSAVAWANQHFQRGLGKSLSDAWSQEHEMVLPDASNTVIPKKEKKSACREAGTCLCGARGKSYQQMHAHFLASLKRSCPQGACKQNLSDGKVFLKIWVKDCMPAAAVPSCTHVHSVFWYSVALMYWSPYRPTLACFKETHSGEPWVSGDSEAIHLEALLAACRLLEPRIYLLSKNHW
eukprot:6463369-Amphidinium_carterae.1